jgi:UDP-N-acetylglucosamine acyltransferase
MTTHPTAIIDPQAKIGKGVSVGPYAVIGANVTIGDHVLIGAGAKIGAFSVPEEQVKIAIGKGTVIYPDAQIMGITTMGEGCKVLAGAKIGGPPQDKGYKNEPTEVIIGDRNFIGENATIHRGTPKDQGKTVIGNDNMIMEGCHIAHDCQLGNGVTMADTKLAGHVHVGDYVTFGGGAKVHQHVHIGQHAMIGGGAAVTADILPYCTAVGGSTPEHHGAMHRMINKIGMERRTVPNGKERMFSDEDVRTVFQAYKMIFGPGSRFEQAPARLREGFPNQPLVEDIAHFMEESLKSKRGIAPGNPQKQHTVAK